MMHHQVRQGFGLESWLGQWVPLPYGGAPTGVGHCLAPKRSPLGCASYVGHRLSVARWLDVIACPLLGGSGALRMWPALAMRVFRGFLWGRCSDLATSALCFGGVHILGLRCALCSWSGLSCAMTRGQTKSGILGLTMVFQ